MAANATGFPASGYALNHARALRIVNAETLLGILGHVRHAPLPAHERDPWFLRERLKPGEVPELPLAHFNLGDPLLEHPSAERAQPGLIVDEHFLRQCLLHGCDSRDWND